MVGDMHNRTLSAGTGPGSGGRNRDSSRRERDDVSRLSEGLDPIHIDEQIPYHPHQSPVCELDALGTHVKDIITTINSLEGLGLQHLKIPLPKIIVIGEQSTGKSSVIEAISGIKTPRSTGTCTRCPLFIKLESPADPAAMWSARVTLRRAFSYDGKRGRDRRFPGWIQLPKPSIVEFMSCDNPDDLEHIIVRAQRAVTSLDDYEDFTEANIESLNGSSSHRSSPNVVCISISKHGLPTLCFYDLPGVIGQSEIPDDVPFSRNLVSEYVKDPEALILVTCSMTNDIANSTAGGIARALKATDRCIGVLTKPDRLLETPCHEILHNVFEKKRLPLGHGYFVVRNLGQEQLDEHLNHEDARAQERQFFDTAEPFASLRQHDSRFGTWNLQSFLSGKLAEQITKKLPIIEEEINARRHEVEEELKQYPAPVTQNAPRVIFDILTEFAQSVRLELEGDLDDHREWRNNWKALQRSLFSSILSLKPTLSTGGTRDKGIYRSSLSGGTSANDSIVLESDDESDGEGSGTGDTWMSGTPETPTKKRKLDSTPGFSPLKNSIPANSPSVAAVVPFPDFTKKRTKFHLDGISQHLEETSNASMPGHYDYRVTDGMSIETLEHWSLPLTEFFNSLEKDLKSRIRALFHKAFRTWESVALYEAAWEIVVQMLDLNLQQQRTTMATESLEDETNSVYVFQKEIFSKEEAAQLELYRQARFKARLARYRHERRHRTCKDITPAEDAKILKNAKLMELLSEEPYSVELGVAATITTYFMTAARRFHDSVCMRIESKFFKQLQNQLRDELEHSLGIYDEDNGNRNAIRLLTEDPKRKALRQELLAKLNALSQGQQILQDLKDKYGDPSSQASGNTMHEGSNSSFGISTPLSTTPLSEEMDEM
ncbi:hypothetical protein HBH98_251920 [Parastagonospora nodorum]|nr:hypothetical protein HBH53_018280 [Parastagonospora nodorum]KAH3956306.1 hypothetical protein HBH51_245280 [Parastagonospora nodorum]KAH4215506.1 hypothetical protein HBI06_248490 [Parastagonospora nodorum]KAH4223058.1 hypothetical protein HBI05_251250 [Parastagonospora nodorum]KAH4332790.1 hypothetical protein HBH98_251920 [Parastagonospora nodorum]